MMVSVVTYDITVGPVCYCLVAEIPTTRLRIKTAVLARNTYNVVSILANLLNPPILNPGAWNLRGKGGFVWAAPCTIALVWTYFRLPETKGRARNFAKEEIAVFERGLEDKLDNEEPIA